MNRLLYLFCAIYFTLGVLYATYTPRWQAPDEPAHFNYIRAIGETGSLPVLQSGDYDQQYLEQIKAAKFPATMSVDAIRYESYQPPLYYLAATPVYFIVRGAGLNVTVIALRLFSVTLGVIVLLVAFAIVRQVFPGDNLLALTTVGAIATVPQHIAVSASISNDLAAEFVLALILLLAVKRVNGKVNDKRFVVLGGVLFGAALLTKTTTYVPGAVVLLGAEFAQVQRSRGAGEQGNNLRFTFYVLLQLFALAALISAPMFIRNMLTYGVTDPLGLARHDSIVIGQPTTVEMIARYGLNHILFDFFAVTFKSFWAQFGWMGVLVNDRIYVVLMILSAFAAFGFALYVWRALVSLRGASFASKQSPARELEIASQAPLAMTLLALMIAAVIADYIGYNFKFLQFQGRYLFPALTPIMLLLVIGLRELIAREYQRVVFALLYLGLLALDVVCLFLFIVPQLKS